jgi:hypothetical protein
MQTVLRGMEQGMLAQAAIVTREMEIESFLSKHLQVSTLVPGKTRIFTMAMTQSPIDPPIDRLSELLLWKRQTMPS